jgi:hypothetical protein
MRRHGQGIISDLENQAVAIPEVDRMSGAGVFVEWSTLTWQRFDLG